MRKRIFGRRLKRDTNARKALFANLMRSLILYGRIETTEAKAKAIKGKVEKLVTRAKIRGEEASNELMRYFDKEIVARLVQDISPKFSSRPGGYTRIIRLTNRKKDNASMVVLEWVEEIAAMNFSSTSDKRIHEKSEKKEEKSKKVEAEVKIKEVKTDKKKEAKKEGKKVSKVKKGSKK